MAMANVFMIRLLFALIEAFIERMRATADVPSPFEEAVIFLVMGDGRVANAMLVVCACQPVLLVMYTCL